MPHPAALILLWACLAVAMQSLQTAGLMLVGVPLLAAACMLSAARLLTLLRRTRWIMLSLLLIYAYTTPGEAVWTPLAQFGPTQEGLTDGLLQLCRLAFALAGLSIVLCLLSQQQLIGGLYTLAYPLCYLGLSRERVAVRLALTLHYAESTMLDTAAGWRSSIENLLAAGGSPPAPRPPEGRASDETTGGTTSHLTRLSKNDSQIIGYSQSTRLAKKANQVHPQVVRRGCTGLKPQQHMQAGYGGVPLAGAPAEAEQHSIELHAAPFTLRDGLLLVAGCTLLGVSLL